MDELSQAFSEKLQQSGGLHNSRDAIQELMSQASSSMTIRHSMSVPAPFTIALIPASESERKEALVKALNGLCGMTRSLIYI